MEGPGLNSGTILRPTNIPLLPWSNHLQLKQQRYLSVAEVPSIDPWPHKKLMSTFYTFQTICDS